MAWTWVTGPEAGELSAPQRFRAGFLVLGAALAALWGWVSALTVPEPAIAIISAIAGAVLVGAIPLARRGHLVAAGWLVAGCAFATMVALLAVIGGDDDRLGAVVVMPLLVGAALGARAALVAGVLLALVVVAFVLAGAAGWASAPGGEAELAAWVPLVRRLTAVTALTVVMRLGFDRVHATLTAHDAELEEANRELAEQNALLEQKVAERTALLARRARAREELARAVAERLRAPLDGIEDSLAQLEGPTREAREVVTASGAAARLAIMIDRLLEHARLGSDFEGGEVDLEAVVDSIVADHCDAGVDWRRGPLPTVRGDATLLHNALANLIGNAVKFSRDRSPPVVEIEWSPAQGAVLVRDNGVGFDPRFADKLFKPFQRLHGVKDFDGIGVGLANVRRVAQAHGGSCWAESELGAGAVFYLALPGLEGEP